MKPQSSLHPGARPSFHLLLVHPSHGVPRAPIPHVDPEVAAGHRLFEYILLYEEGVMFQIEQVTKQCSKIPLTEPWDPLDIPQNSTFEDEYSIGGPQEQITVQEWSDRKSARSYETWIGVYTAKDCYPVQEMFIRNYSVVLSTRFFDVQLGIKDPSVFNPPSTCQMARLEKMSEDCLW
ncbi:mammalian ependymin-related protein 1 isoform X2 [Dipodomys merriami]|uniref:mammalian ependymin-related protein 1 isoform X2 n=1 Tax=Dipodomys merriami TaxID=94247 RepID=UPI003855FF7B